MGLETVGVMSSHMGFQIISTGKSYKKRSLNDDNTILQMTHTSWTSSAFVFLAWIILGLIINSSEGASVRH